MRSSTPTLISALLILARDIQSNDGVANAAIAEAADRLQELSRENARLQMELDASCNAEELRQVRAENAALSEDKARMEYLLRELSGPRPFWQWHKWTREQMIVVIDAARKEAQP